MESLFVSLGFDVTRYDDLKTFDISITMRKSTYDVCEEQLYLYVKHMFVLLIVCRKILLCNFAAVSLQLLRRITVMRIALRASS